MFRSIRVRKSGCVVRFRDRVPPKKLLKPRTPRLGALGQAIERSRRVGGLSQRELSERSGLHTTQISGLERGTRNPTYESLVELAAGLGVSVGELAVSADEIYDQLAAGEQGTEEKGLRLHGVDWFH
jgi:transcriptional regulator with XRE-family HTH domain